MELLWSSLGGGHQLLSMPFDVEVMQLPILNMYQHLTRPSHTHKVLVQRQLPLRVAIVNSPIWTRFVAARH